MSMCEAQQSCHFAFIAHSDCGTGAFSYLLSVEVICFKDEEESPVFQRKDKILSEVEIWRSQAHGVTHDESLGLSSVFLKSPILSQKTEAVCSYRELASKAKSGNHGSLSSSINEFEWLLGLIVWYWGPHHSSSTYCPSAFWEPGLPPLFPAALPPAMVVGPRAALTFFSIACLALAVPFSFCYFLVRSSVNCWCVSGPH